MFTVGQHPVEFIPAGLHHVPDGGLYRLLPGLTGKHSGHHLSGAEQAGGIGIAGHVFKAHIDIEMRHPGEHLLVQGRFAVTHPHQANQQGARLADHAFICP